MTDKQTYNINFDYNLNIEIQSNSLNEEAKEVLETMLNERENDLNYDTLPEIDHMIKSNSFGFEVQLSTSEGKIEDIVENFIQEQKELQEQLEYEQGMHLINLNNQLEQELNALSL